MRDWLCLDDGQLFDPNAVATEQIECELALCAAAAVSGQP
jgi:hypothetical protein